MALKPGWEDAGNNLVTNTATGQTVDQNHPIYLNDGGAPPAQPGGATAPLPAPAGAATPAATPAPTGLPAGATDMGNNLVKLASGQVVPRDHPLFQQAMAAGAAPGAAGAPTTIGTGATTPIPGATPAQPQTVNDAFRSALLTQLNTSPTVTASDPTIKAQTDAFNTGQQRSQERSQNTLAEAAALDGTRTSGGFTADKLGLEEGRAQAEGTFSAGLVGKELQSRRDQIAQALQMGAGYLSDQDHMALQKQLADLDAAIRREGLTVQSTLGQGDLAARDKAINAQSNLGLIEALLQNEQSGNNLGFNYTQLQTNANRDAVLAALGR